MAKTTLSSDFKTFKEKSLIFHQTLEKAKFYPDKKLDRLLHCAEYMQFAYDETLEHQKVLKGSYCKDRWCPVCSSRRGYKTANELYAILNYSFSVGFKAVFLTLTVPSCSGTQLPEVVARLKSSWRKFYRRKDFMHGFAAGCWISWECTYNELEGYHPHAHIIILVQNSYFNKYNIWRPEDLAIEWKDCTGYDIDPSAQEIKRVESFSQANKLTLNNTVGKKSNKKSIPFEALSKYVNEDDFFYIYDIELFKPLYAAYKSKKKYHYTGIFTKMHKLFLAGHLDQYLPEEKVDYIIAVSCVWDFQQSKYLIKEAYFIDSKEPVDVAKRRRLDLII